MQVTPCSRPASRSPRPRFRPARRRPFTVRARRGFRRRDCRPRSWARWRPRGASASWSSWRGASRRCRRCRSRRRAGGSTRRTRGTSPRSARRGVSPGRTGGPRRMPSESTVAVVPSARPLARSLQSTRPNPSTSLPPVSNILIQEIILWALRKFWFCQWSRILYSFKEIIGVVVDFKWNVYSLKKNICF